MKGPGFTYILQCCDGSYYTGSTLNLKIRLQEHQSGRGANHTKMRLPVILAYSESYPTIQMAYYREKQIQGWSRSKKKALIDGKLQQLPRLSKKKT